MSVTAALLVLNLGLLAQALAIIPQYAGSGDETADAQVEVTNKKNSLAASRFSEELSILTLAYGYRFQKFFFLSTTI